MNKRTAARVYRKYLAYQEEKGAEQVGKGTEREEKLKQAAEINAERWQDTKPQEEMSAKTRKLREMVVHMGIQ